MRPDGEEINPFAGLEEFIESYGSLGRVPPPPPQSTTSTSDSDSPRINIQPMAAGRSKIRPAVGEQLLLIISMSLLGTGLGLLASYWCQPLFYRGVTSLGSYAASVPGLLSHVTEFQNPDPTSLVRESVLGSMARTMVAVTLVGSLFGLLLSLFMAQRIAKQVQLRNAIRLASFIVIVTSICIAVVLVISTVNEVMAYDRQIQRFHAQKRELKRQQREAVGFLSSSVERVMPLVFGCGTLILG